MAPVRGRREHLTSGYTVSSEGLTRLGQCSGMTPEVSVQVGRREVLVHEQPDLPNESD